jgi:hypothetical protein
MQSNTNNTGVEPLIPLDFASGTILVLGSILGKTWRFAIEGTGEIDPFRDRGKGVIFCFWHSNILPLAYIFRGAGVTAVVSASKDGDRATAVAQRWNHTTIRGSSSRGQIGVIRQCMRALEMGRNVVIIPDGPHGPREHVKPGAAMIALTTNAPVYPVILRSNQSWRLNSWDRFLIPKPFSKITVEFREALRPSQFSNIENRVDLFAQTLQKSLLA